MATINARPLTTGDENTWPRSGVWSTALSFKPSSSANSTRRLRVLGAAIDDQDHVTTDQQRRRGDGFRLVPQIEHLAAFAVFGRQNV